MASSGSVTSHKIQQRALDHKLQGSGQSTFNEGFLGKNFLMKMFEVLMAFLWHTVMTPSSSQAFWICF